MPEWFDGSEVVGILKDGRVIAKAWRSAVVAAGDVNFVVRIPDLKYIDAVLNIEFYTDPATYIESGYANKKISGNVVGMTIYGVAAGTTLTAEVVAVGPP